MKIKYAMAFGLLLLTSVVYADSTQLTRVDAGTELERAELAQIIRELQLLQGRVSEAERQSLSASRFPFDYQSLRRDLREVEQGIRSYLETPLRTPRSIPALNSEYRYPAR